MKRFLLITLIGIGFSIGLFAKTVAAQNEIQVMSDAQIRKMDKQQNLNKAKKRNFKTLKEFQHKTQRKQAKHLKKNSKYNKKLQHQAQRKQSKHPKYNNRYDNDHNFNRPVYRDQRRINRQRGYRYGKRGWTLAYRYDRATFYDNEGYYYGYFNRNGYFFDNVFYRYDRYYKYRDRVRGRGLFDYRYYMPTNAQYYGFSR